MATRTCEHCHSTLRIADAGKAVRCPRCHTVNQPLAPAAATPQGGSSHKHLPANSAHPAISGGDRSEGDTEEMSIQETIIGKPLPHGENASEAGGAPAVPSEPAAEREAALGPYQLQQEIGRGGMGLVLQGYDQALKREVAIKTLHQRTRADPVKRMRFIKEAQITGQLEHPGIVPVHFLGWDSGGNEFFSMKLASGEPFDRILDRWHKGDAETRRRYPLTRLLSFFERICETIGFAHARGVMHRDLKPGNVMIGTHGEVWVLDWGLAKVLDNSGGGGSGGALEKNAGGAANAANAGGAGESGRMARPVARISSDVANDVTLDGLVVGTPEYMAPEQAAGEKLDEGVDIFSLGAMLYEILTAQPPRSGKTLNEVITRAAQGHFTPVRRTQRGKTAPPALVAIAEKCLSPRRRDRYASVQDLLHDLRSYAAGQQVSALPDTLLAKMRRMLRRHGRLAAAIGGVAALVLILATVASVLVARKDREAKYEQEQRLQAVIEQQKAEAEKQAALAASAEKAQRRMKAFQPYVQAMDLLMRGQLPERAAALLDKSLQIDPEFPEAQFALAEAYRMAGIPASAAEAYLKADELNVRIGGRHNLSAIVAAGFTYDGAGQYAEAQDCFERADKFGADDPLAKVGRCFMLCYQQHLEEARKLANETLKEGGHLWEAHFAAGYVLVEQIKDGILPAKGNRETAIREFRKAIELAPRQAEPRIWLAGALQLGAPTESEHAERRALFDKAIELEPLNGNRYVTRASYHFDQGEFDAAKADIAEARRLKAWEPLISNYETHQALLESNPERAYTLMHTIIASYKWPPHVYTRLFLGLSLHKDQEDHELLPAIERFTRDNPRYAYVYVLQGLLRMRQGDYKAALAQYKKGLAIAPYNLMLLRYTANALMASRQFGEALAAVDQALEAVPGDPGASLGKAQALTGLKRYDAALKTLDTVDRSPQPSIREASARLREMIERIRARK